jgi:hypoxanthine phosphoribosyltransferase
MNDIQSILFDEKAIAAKVEELARRISADYAGKDLVLVCILKGAVLFFADLMRAISIPFQVDFLHASSYGCSLSSSGEIVLKKDIDLDISGKHVLLIDTIIDSGRTLDRLFHIFQDRGSASVCAAVLLSKTSRRITEVPVAYTGFEIPDLFVVGYGMDYGERYRNLTCVAALQENHT